MRRLRDRSHPVAIALVLCLTAACGRSTASPSPLTVAAPTALQVPLLAARPAIIGRHPGWQIEFRFLAAPSAAAIATAGADVVATPDEAAMAQLVRDGVVDVPQRFAHDLLQIAVPTANPHHIQSLADLANTRGRVVIVDPSTPTGRHTARVLAATSVQLNLTTAASPAAALELVANGGADAALVETSDLKSAPPGVSGVPVTPVDLALVTYQVAVVKGSAHRAAAQGLVDELLGASQVTLRDHGFLSP
jgi:molybdate transport system substrate-binding protein